jgi:biopolymer transport protein ExbD
MGLKRKNKVQAQFNMSSLTDIIFLLLIFFMLTSTLVAPNALNLKLPGRSKSPVAQTEQLPDVRVYSSGTYAINGRNATSAEVDRELRAISRKADRSFTISPEKEAPVETVVYVMDLAMRYQLNAILLPEE